MLIQENAGQAVFSRCKRGNRPHPTWIGLAPREHRTGLLSSPLPVDLGLLTSRYKHCPCGQPDSQSLRHDRSSGEESGPGLPPAPRGFVPRGHSLLTGLHQLYEVREQNIPVPLAEAIHIIGDLEGDRVGGNEGLRPGGVGAAYSPGGQGSCGGLQPDFGAGSAIQGGGSPWCNYSLQEGGSSRLARRPLVVSAAP